MRESLQAFLPMVKRHEGGYVNHPRDPGGCTNLGITLRTLQRHVPGASCQTVKNLDWETAATIYRDSYWGAVRGDDLTTGVDAVVFDHGINAGPRASIKLLQGVVGASKDGIIGPITLTLVDRVNPVDLIKRLSKARLSYYQRLRNWRTFGKGWARRVRETENWALDYTKK